MGKSNRRQQASKRDRISTKVHDRIAMARVDAAIRTEQQWQESATRSVWSAIPGEIGMSGEVVLA
jgi:hypothetical protein